MCGRAPSGAAGGSYPAPTPRARPPRCRCGHAITDAEHAALEDRSYVLSFEPYIKAKQPLRALGADDDGRPPVMHLGKPPPLRASDGAPPAPLLRAPLLPAPECLRTCGRPRRPARVRRPCRRVVGRGAQPRPGVWPEFAERAGAAPLSSSRATSSRRPPSPCGGARCPARRAGAGRAPRPTAAAAVGGGGRRQLVAAAPPAAPAAADLRVARTSKCCRARRPRRVLRRDGGGGLSGGAVRVAYKALHESPFSDAALEEVVTSIGAEHLRPPPPPTPPAFHAALAAGDAAELKHEEGWWPVALRRCVAPRSR